MIFRKTRQNICMLLCITFLMPVCWADPGFGGHIKYFFTYTDFPDDSAFSSIASPYRESLGNMRLKANTRAGRWDAELHYVLNGLYSKDLSDCIVRGGGLAGNGCSQLASDQRQLFDLSSVILETDETILYQRVDRLVLSYSTENLVARFGRQAISWGNGMVYNPLDLFNPFPPDAIDTEYKSGDDMVYLQSLFRNGSDLQALYVPRRDPLSDDIDSRQSAYAGKYHLLRAAYEMDFLAALNYGDEIAGVSYTGEWRQNVVNASVSATHTDSGITWSVAANYNYSTTVIDRNMTGFVELFYNGFGLQGNRHTAEDVIAESDLFKRLIRGELFTIGRYYLATGIGLEMTPLLNLNPVLFINLGDRSALLQFSGIYSVRQNLDLLAGINLPAGAEGTEYGGITSDQETGVQLAPGINLFARLAWYF